MIYVSGPFLPVRVGFLAAVAREAVFCDLDGNPNAILAQVMYLAQACMAHSEMPQFSFGERA